MLKKQNKLEYVQQILEKIQHSCSDHPLSFAADDFTFVFLPAHPPMYLLSGYSNAQIILFADVQLSDFSLETQSEFFPIQKDIEKIRVEKLFI